MGERVKQKVVVIGLDSAGQSLLCRWAGTGVLPVLAGLLKRGAWGVTDLPPGLSAVVWPTFYSGLFPNQHGRYFYDQIVPGTYKTRILPHGKLQQGKPFWEAVSQAGQRVIVVDVPKSALAEGLNGIQLVDWANHDPDTFGPPHFWPHNLGREITRRFGSDPLKTNDFGGRGPADYGLFKDRLIRNIERKTKLMRALITESEWDLVVTVFDDMHQLSHLCWHLHDPTHPKSDPQVIARVGNPIKDVFQALDRAIGQLLDVLPPGTTVLIFSSQGMGPKYHWNEELDHILRVMEGISNARGRVHRQLKKLWDALPHRLQHPCAELKSRLREWTLGPERSKRRYFAIPSNDEIGAIRINLKEREPRGIVEPGIEFDALCEQIENELMTLKDVKTGKSIVKQVVKVSDLYPTGLLEYLPDLLVEWTCEEPVLTVHAPRLGTFSKNFMGTRSGSHRGEGLFIFSGSGISPRRLSRKIDVVDLAPTIATMLNVPFPDVSGKPISEVLN